MLQGQYIKGVLKTNKLTQETLAKKIGRSRAYVIAHLKRAIIDDDFLKEISPFVNVTKSDLPNPTEQQIVNNIYPELSKHLTKTIIQEETMEGLTSSERVEINNLKIQIAELQQKLIDVLIDRDERLRVKDDTIDILRSENNKLQAEIHNLQKVIGTNGRKAG